MYVLSHGSIKVKTGSFQQATFDDTGVYQHVSTVLAGISHWISIFDVFFSQLVKIGELLANGDPIPSRRGCWKVPWQRDARGCWWICSWKNTDQFLFSNWFLILKVPREMRGSHPRSADVSHVFRTCISAPLSLGQVKCRWQHQWRLT